MSIYTSEDSLKFQMIGTAKNKVLYREFSETIKLFKDSLNVAALSITKVSTEYDVYISEDVPAAAELKAVSTADNDAGVKAINLLFNTLLSISKPTTVPPNLALIEIVQKLLSPNRTSKLVLYHNDLQVDLDQKFNQNIDFLLGPNEYEHGSIVGTLKQVVADDGTNGFELHPTSRRGIIVCEFPETLKNEAINAVGKRIEIFGRLVSKRNIRYPYKIEVKKFEVYPPDDELPSLDDLWGIALTGNLGGLSSEKFII